MEPSVDVEQRLALLARELAELREAVRPQRVRNSLERTWNPRGTADEVRVEGLDGIKLPAIRRTIQFLGGVTDDPANNRYVVAAGGGDEFEFDGGSTYPAGSRINWLDSADGVTVRGTINTATIGSARYFTMAVPDYPQPASQYAAHTRMEAGASSSSIRVVSLHSSASTFADYLGEITSTSATSTMQAQRSGTGTSAKYVQTANNGAASAVATVQNSGVTSVITQTETTITVVAGAITRRLIDNAALSNFMQLEATGATTPLKRVMRGPFSAAPGSLAAAGGTTTVSVTNAAPGANCVVMGGIKGAAGMEFVLWSYTVSGSNAVISFTNTDPANALTPTLEFYTACDS